MLITYSNPEKLYPEKYILPFIMIYFPDAKEDQNSWFILTLFTTVRYSKWDLILIPNNIRADEHIQTEQSFPQKACMSSHASP